MTRPSWTITLGASLVALILFLSTNSSNQESEPAALTEAALPLNVQTWCHKWATTADLPDERKAIITQAVQEYDKVLALMQTTPAAVFDLAMSLTAHAALPTELQPFFPVIFSGLGDLDQQWATQLREDGSKSCQGHSILRLHRETLTVQKGERAMVPVLNNVPLAGIRLGKNAVISTSASVPLNEEDLAFLGADQLHTQDPVNGETGRSEYALYFAGQAHLFESVSTLKAFEAAYSEAFAEAGKMLNASLINPFPVLAGNIGGNTAGSNQATPYQADELKVLFVRVDFSDFTGEPVSKTDLEATLASVNSHIENFSYNQAGITYTVSTTLYQMPKTGTSYAVNGDNDGLIEDARDLASADFTLGNYDVVAVFFPDLSEVSDSQITYGGLASIGGANHWINGVNSAPLLTHEFGHNYGLYHANYQHPENELAGEYQAGILEYGDIFDEMGKGSSPEGHFSHLAKNHLDWLPDSKVAEANSDETFTIYRFDDANALTNDTLALKVPMSGETYYWIGYRQLHTSSEYNLSNAAYVVADNLAESRETTLIDMTPDSQVTEVLDRKDAGLPVGSSFYDSTAGVRLTALSSGGTDPNQWIQVQVEFDPRIRIVSDSIEIDEQAGSARVQVARTYSTSGAVSVDYSSSAGTATAESDYYSVSGQLQWADGDSTVKTISIPIRPDNTPENRETFTLSLSNISGGVLDTGANAATITILDPGQRYMSFAPSFFNSTVRAIQPLSNGQVVIGGSINSMDGVTLNNIARLNADGTLDTSFNTDGSGFNDSVRAIVQQADGSLLVGGDFTSYNGNSCNRIVRVSADGALDTAFLTEIGSAADNSVYTIGEETDGSILVGGQFETFNGEAVEGLIRLTSSGAKNTENALSLPFKSTWDSSIHHLQLEPDGKIITVGSFYIPPISGSGIRSGIARLNIDGTRDTSFDPDAGFHTAGVTNTLNTAYTIARQPDGKYLVGGSFSAYDETNVDMVIRILNNGAIDTSFEPDSYDETVWAIRRQVGDRVLTGGRFSRPESHLARLDTSGTTDPLFTPFGGPSGPVYSFAKDDDGALFIGGNFFSYEGAASRPLVKVASGEASYEVWIEDYFSFTEISAGASAVSADPDNDGLVNLAEYAMGTNPTLFDADTIFGVAEGGITLQSVGDDTYLQITLNKSSDVPGAWYAAQFGNDLSNLLPSTPSLQSNSIYQVVEDSPITYTVRDHTPISSATKRFARVKLVLPE